jgi:hypothetical protein
VFLELRSSVLSKQFIQLGIYLFHVGALVGLGKAMENNRAQVTQHRLDGIYLHFGLVQLGYLFVLTHPALDQELQLLQKVSYHILEMLLNKKTPMTLIVRLVKILTVHTHYCRWMKPHQVHKKNYTKRPHIICLS